LRFPGQYYDSETGLHYNRYRYYNSMIGRYFRIDPVHHFNGDDENIPYILFFLLKTPTALHNYNYANINPLKNVDSKGLACGPGSGMGDKLISDIPSGCNFTQCCEMHDDCYAGYNQPCKLYTREECDRGFLFCMLISNPRIKCIHPAITYYLAVRSGGWTRY